MQIIVFSIIIILKTPMFLPMTDFKRSRKSTPTSTSTSTSQHKLDQVNRLPSLKKVPPHIHYTHYYSTNK